MFDGEFDIIRPLILLNDGEVRRYARIREFPGQKKECPYGEDSKRGEIRNLLRQFYGLNRKARTNIYRSITNIRTGYPPSAGAASKRK
jgi:tRNA(Ile)-lysidine synthase TilS/MesJ